MGNTAELFVGILGSLKHVDSGAIKNKIVETATFEVF
jgi:hypothetical protein